jgi:hypothetical protein
MFLSFGAPELSLGLKFQLQLSVLDSLVFIKLKSFAGEGKQRFTRLTSPVGLGTKNHCAREGQQQFSSQRIAKRCNKRSASAGRPTPPFVKKRAPFLKHVHVFERKKESWSYISTRPKAKNDCAGEDQLQFNRHYSLTSAEKVRLDCCCCC